MSVVEKVNKVLDKNKQLIENDPQKLSEFVEELKKEGLLIKREYELQPLDMIGRQLYQNANLDKSKKIENI